MDTIFHGIHGVMGYTPLTGWALRAHASGAHPIAPSVKRNPRLNQIKQSNQTGTAYALTCKMQVTLYAIFGFFGRSDTKMSITIMFYTQIYTKKDYKKSKKGTSPCRVKPSTSLCFNTWETLYTIFWFFGCINIKISGSIVILAQIYPISEIFTYFQSLSNEKSWYQNELQYLRVEIWRFWHHKIFYRGQIKLASFSNPTGRIYFQNFS